MSPEDGESTDTPSSGAPPPGRRSRLRGLGLALLAVAASGLVVVLAGLALLHTPPGATAARVSLERWLSLAAGGPVRIGRLEPRLWRGEAAADAVSVGLPGTSVAVGRVEVAWSPAGGLRVRLVRPAVAVRDTGEPASDVRAEGLAAQPWRVLERLDEAEVVDGRVELRDAADEPWLVLEGVGATLSGPRDIQVRVASGAFGWPEGGLRVKPATAEATLALEDGGLVIDSLRVASGTAAIDLSGRLERLSPTTATATARVGFDGGLVAALAPEAQVEGRVEGDVSVELVEDRVRGALDVASPRLSVSGVGPWAARGHARLEGSRLVLDPLVAEGFGGRLVAEGPLALLATARTEARVRAEGIDVAALARALSGAEVPVAARADAALSWTTTGWDVEGARGDGEIALRPTGRSPRAKVPGVPLAGSGRVRIEGLAVALEGARMEARGATLEADAAVSPAGALSGTWQAGLPLEAVDALAADLGSEARLPEGYAGVLAGEGDLGGTTAAPEATARLRSDGLEARGKRLGVEADARYAEGRLSLAPLVVRSGLGQATLAGSLPVAADAGEWDLGGTVDTLELAPALALAGIEGSGPATGTLRIEGPTGRPRGRADLEARVELEGERAGESIAATLAASSDGARVEIERLSAEVAGGTIDGSGAYDLEGGSFEAKAEAAGLEWSRLPRLPPLARRLGGTFSGSLRLSGTAEAPAGEAAARLDGTTLDGAPLPDLAFEARADGRRLDLAARSGESAFLEGGGPLEGDWPVRLAIDVAALPAQALLDALPAVKDRGATLEAQGSLVVDVPLRDPGAYRWSGEGLAAHGRLRILEWSTEPFRASGTSEEVRLDGLRLATRGRVRGGGAGHGDPEDAAPAPEGARAAEPAGGVLSVDGRVPLAEGRSFDLAVRGDFTLAAVAAVMEDAQAGGSASLEARVEGTVDAPDVRGTFALSGGRFRVEDARLSALEVEGRFEGRQAILDRASARLLGGRLLASGSLPLATLDAGRVARLRVEAADVDLSRLAVPTSERTEDSPSFRVSVEGVLEADEPRLAGLRGEGRFTKVESRSNEGTVGLAAPARWTLAGGRFEQEPIRLAGPLGTLEARLALDLDGATKGSAALAGPFDLRLVSPFMPDTRLSGPARVDLRAEWDGAAARLEGGLSVDGGRLTLETLNFSLSRIRGEARFLGDRAELDATAESGDGRMVAYGGMSFGPSLLGPAAVSIEAERLPIAYPEGFRARATGALLVEGDAGRYRVSGLVDLTQAFYTAEFDARKESLDRLDYQLAALRARGSIADALPLAIDVRFRDPLRIRNSQAQLDVTGTITANGTLAQPAAAGQLALVEGGRLTVRRARIRVDEGRVELNGYPAGIPEVDFEGLTQVGGVTMVVRAQGSLDELQLDISSPNRPEMSQTDLVALLLTGRTSTAAADQGKAILAEEVAAALGGALQRNVGEAFLIDVSSDDSMLLDEGDPTQRFRIGTRVARDLSVFYSTRLDGTEQRWVGQWNPRGGRFTLRAIDDREEGVLVEASDRLTFNVFPGRERRKRTEARLVKVVSLRLEGDLPLPEEELLRASRLQAGRRYDPLRLLESADRVRARLVAADHRAAWVEVRETAADGGENRVDLVLHVEAGPRIVLTWAGDDPGAKLRRLALEAWPPHASVEAAAASIARTVRIGLQAEGHYEARVGHEAREDGARAEVTLTVTRGPRGRGVDVVFEGNTRLTAEELARTLPRAGSREFFEALDRPAQLVARARVAYAGLGHIRARVGPPRTRFDEATGRLEVRLNVREGAAARVSALVLPEGIAAPADGGPELRLREGEPFDVEAYLADRDALAAWYRREGFTEARVRGLLEPRAGDVHVTMIADTGEQVRLGEVRITSSGRTREPLVRRSLRLEPGEVILPRQLAETRARLADLGTFTSVDVRTVPAPGREGVRDVELSFVERPDVELEYGLRYDFSGSGGADSPPDGPSEGRLQAAAALRLANPLGWGWNFGAYTLQTSARHNYRLGIGAPTLAGRRVKTQVLAFDETDDEAAIAASYASKVRGFSVQQSHTLLWDTGSRRWHERLRLQWGYTNKDIRYSETIGSDDLVAGNRAFLSLALIGDERDSLTDPRRGFFWTATTEWSRRFLGSDVDYVRAYGQLFTYLPLPGGLVWAQGYRAGLVPGDDPFYLLENRFQAGGPTTVRGFRQNGLGPQLDEDEGLGGQAVFVFNQEVRFPIWKSLKGGVFWDAGNSWLLASEFSVRDLRHTVGGGLRIMLPFGPIRLEYGFILDRRKNSDGSYVEPLGRFVFGLGHAF